MRQRELKEGLLVKYTAGHGTVEYGIVSSWNNTAVFVRYFNPKTGVFAETGTATPLRSISTTTMEALVGSAREESGGESHGT